MQTAIRAYSFGPGIGSNFIVIGAFVLFLLPGIVKGPDAQMGPLFMMASLFLVVSLLFRSTVSATTMIEVDSSEGLIRKISGSLFRKQVCIFSLEDIHDVHFLRRDLLIEEGNGVTLYTIVIDRGRASADGLL